MTWASCTFDGCDLGYILVLNPGACRGTTWLIEYLGDVPILVVVEADTASDAIEVLSDDPEFGQAFLFAHERHDAPVDTPQNPPPTIRVGFRGGDRCHPPYPVRYFGEGYPEQGID